MEPDAFSVFIKTVGIGFLIAFILWMILKFNEPKGSV
jgi:hypothetical protein